MMKKLLFIVLTTSLIASCGRQAKFESAEQMVEHAARKTEVMTPEKLHEMMEAYETYTLIDVRQELEHYHGYIPGSVNIPRGSLEFKINDSTFWDNTGLYQPAKDEMIILYCEKGHRSVLAAQALQQLGYKKVYHLKEGYKKWSLTYPELFEKDLDKLSGQSDKPAKSGSC
jgi:rhodanese-related sulfurtransferase